MLMNIINKYLHFSCKFNDNITKKAKAKQAEISNSAHELLLGRDLVFVNA